MATTGAPPFKVKATYDYTSSHEDDLSFSQGQIITVTEVEGDEWFIGEYADASGNVNSGLFPSNFVERFEPAPPPRPVRTNRSKPSEVPVGKGPAVTADDDLQAAPQQDASKHKTTDEVVDVPQVSSDITPDQTAKPPAGSSSTKTAELRSQGPPPVAAKSSSFRDRIAAFNKSAAPPVAPFKPAALGSSGFIKKPFVAPPPSRNAYVPPPTRDIPAQTFYRREEDPEIAQRQAQDLENAERAGLIPTEDAEDDEEVSKPVSLKERIALLQKQQMEQAARPREVSSKKGTKKRADATQASEGEPSTVDSGPRRSMDVDEQHATSQPQFRVPKVPGHDFSDGNDADISTTGDYTEPEGPIGEASELSGGTIVDSSVQGKSDVEDAGSEEDDEEDMDEDARHQLALRQRMAKLSGGMGMPGMSAMFGPPGGMPMMGMAAPAQKKKKPQDSQQRTRDEDAAPMKLARAPSVPIADRTHQQHVEQRTSTEELRTSPEEQDGTPTNQAPLDVASPSAGSETDDELPGTSQARDSELSMRPVPALPAAPPVPRRQASVSQQSPTDATAEGSLPFPVRTVPAIPTDTPLIAPPRSTSLISSPPGHRLGVEGESEYEGDYDTDIASSAKHKDALKTHAREQSIYNSPGVEEREMASSFVDTNSTVGSALPSRPVPPPPPSATIRPRASIDTTRVPASGNPNQDALSPMSQDDYDPYRYGPPPISPGHSATNSPMIRSPPIPSNSFSPPPVPGHVAPPPVPSGVAAPPPVPSTIPPPPMPHQNSEDDSEAEEEIVQQPRNPPQATEPFHSRDQSQQREPSKRNSRSEAVFSRSTRSSVDAERTPIQRRSTDQHRLSTSNEFIASDINLGEGSRWWASANQLPPTLQNRNDIFFEVEESTVQKRGGKSLINKDLYVLFRDYSQTVISVRFDPKNPTDVSFEQKHDPPPPFMRQDQLESAYNTYGVKIATAATTAQNTVVGDGSSQSLINELVRTLDGALPPVGTRAYGALVYSNLANATVQQFDEIRPGDIVSFRNAKFQGKHSGVMHQKYQLEAGKPDHAAIVLEWDGTKKKIRAVEQGRESKKCKVESFRLGDLRSGEVRVWRVMSRAWVGWDPQSA